MNVLVLGVTGMLGHAVYGTFMAEPRFKVWGTVRNPSKLPGLQNADASRVFRSIDALDNDAVVSVFDRSQPHVVINCVGVIKQLSEANDPLVSLPINAMLPHRLAKLCSSIGARLVHVSTDCVFSGSRGHYSESDPADAEDLYGRSKHLGELHGLPHAITLRTLIIGPSGMRIYYRLDVRQ